MKNYWHWFLVVLQYSSRRTMMCILYCSVIFSKQLKLPLLWTPNNRSCPIHSPLYLNLLPHNHTCTMQNKDIFLLADGAQEIHNHSKQKLIWGADFVSLVATLDPWDTGDGREHLKCDSFPRMEIEDEWNTVSLPRATMQESQAYTKWHRGGSTTCGGT